jgi:hypothetical protein
VMNRYRFGLLAALIGLGGALTGAAEMAAK